MKISIIYYAYKKNIKTKLLDEYVIFVDLTKRQIKYFKTLIISFVVNLCLFLFFVYLIIIQSSICTFIIMIIKFFV